MELLRASDTTFLIRFGKVMSAPFQNKTLACYEALTKNKINGVTQFQCAARKAIIGTAREATAGHC